MTQIAREDDITKFPIVVTLHAILVCYIMITFAFLPQYTT